MSIVIKYSMTGQAKRTLRELGERAGIIADNLSTAHAQGLQEVETHVKRSYLSGAYRKGVRRGGDAPAAARSGILRASVASRQDRPLSGFVGVPSGSPASAYAGTVLGDGTTVIKPKSANHLWVPLPDNQTGRGITRVSPRELMGRTRPRKRGSGGPVKDYVIFRSRRGNLIAGTTGPVPGVRRKGLKALFVLKKQVRVEGIDALGGAFADQLPRLADLLQDGADAGAEGRRL